MKYKTNKKELAIVTKHRKIDFSSDILINALTYAHKIIEQIADFEVDIFSILGMRNLSAFIGEIFVISIEKQASEKFKKNPHQDGYPDLLSMHEEGKSLWDSLKKIPNEKAPFSPFAEGGIEIKATCGSIPTPKMCQKKGVKRPEIGDSRIDLLTGYDWKAHHRETNNLVGIVWDFIDNIPKIVAIFYSSSLSDSDWGVVVKPKEGGGRTTSVSIINRDGIKTMYGGWIAVYDDARYIDFFNKYNKSDQIK